MFLLLATSYHVATRHLFLRNLIQKMKGVVSISYLIPITLLLFLANFTSISYDEGLYHANFIRWVNSYPCIRGIANLHGRLGFNGTWHVMAAAFNGFPFFKIESNSLNFIAICCFFLFFLIEAKQTGAEDFNHLIIFLAFPILLIYHFIDPSAELILYFFGLALLMEIVQVELNQSPGDLRFWLIAFPFLVCVKINFALYFPLLCYYVIREIRTHTHRWKFYLSILATSGILFATIWIISNILISGYMVYPYLKTPLHPRWEVPVSYAAEEMNGISHTPVIRWAGISALTAQRNSHLLNFMLWLKHVRLVEKMIFLVFGLLMVFNALKDTLLGQLRLSHFILLQFITQILLVPDLRFSMALGIIAMFQSKHHFFKRRLKLSTTTLVLSLVVQVIITMLLYIHLFPQLFKTKPNLFSFYTKLPYHSEKFEKIKVDKIDIFINPMNDFVWDSIPAFYPLRGCEKDPRNIGVMGDNIEDGFYTKPESH